MQVLSSIRRLPGKLRGGLLDEAESISGSAMGFGLPWVRALLLVPGAKHWFGKALRLGGRLFSFPGIALLVWTTASEGTAGR
jgi:hypothetical protein